MTYEKASLICFALVPAIVKCDVQDCRGYIISDVIESILLKVIATCERVHMLEQTEILIYFLTWSNFKNSQEGYGEWEGTGHFEAWRQLAFLMWASGSLYTDPEIADPIPSRSRTFAFFLPHPFPIDDRFEFISNLVLILNQRPLNASVLLLFLLKINLNEFEYDYVNGPLEKRKNYSRPIE